MATHSNTLAWETVTEEPVGHSPRGQKDLDMTESAQHSTAYR